jgi:hypothetical protein
VSGSIEDELRELVALATLGEGVLREKDEHRLVKVALARGLSLVEARRAIEVAVAAVGARRAPPESGSERSSSGASGPAARPKDAGDASATEGAIRRATRRLRIDPRPPAEDEEAIVAEIVDPAPDLVPAPDADASASGVCAGCLASVAAHDLASGRAERAPDGRVHCRACVSKLRSGLLCGKCYQPLERAELASGRARAAGDRAFHVACMPPPPPRAVEPAPSSGATPLLVSEVAKPLAGPTPPPAAKCHGCHVILTRLHFAEGRARRVDGVAYCAACAQRAGRGSS